MSLTINTIDGLSKTQHPTTVLADDDGPCVVANQDWLLPALLNLSCEAIICISPDFLVTVFSKGAEEIFGYRADEIIGRSFETLIPISKRDGHRKHTKTFEASDLPQKNMRGRESIEGLTKDGKKFPAETSVHKVQKEDGAHFIVTLRDISRRKRAEASENRLGRILDSSLNEVYVFDAATFDCLSTNRGARDSLGYSFEEMRELKFSDVNVELDGPVRDQLLKPLRTGQQDTIVFETTHRRKDGSLYPAEVHLEMMRNEDPPVFVTFIRNIDERKKNEQTLRKAAATATAEAANRSKSEFLANMSHELRTPLNAIIGFSELICKEILGPIGEPKYLEYGRDIHFSGKHLLELITGILDLAKIEAGQFKLRKHLVHVSEVIGSCQRILKHSLERSNVKLVTDVDINLPPLYCDEQALRQILINLLSNAIKFSTDHNVVTVSAKVGDGGDLVLMVADEGIGIAPENIPVALSVFSQIESSANRKHEGTGLGLPLVKMLVELHEGTFVLESALGVGTKAIVRLPFRQLEANVAPAAKEARVSG